VRATSVKFAVQVGNMKLKTQNKEWINIPTVICTILPVYFSIYQKTASTLYLGVARERIKTFFSF
jgi:hypothetical protein